MASREKLLIAWALTGVFFVVGCQQQTEPLSQNDGPATLLPDGANSGQQEPNPDGQTKIDLTNPGDIFRGQTEPQIINTLDFEVQIQNPEPFAGEITSSSVGRPPKHGKPKIKIGPTNDLQAGNVAGFNRVAPAAKFPGISQTPLSPPDPSLAVGPNHIVQVVNSSIAFFTKNGTMQFLQVLNNSQNPGFFDEVNAGSFVFDPKCFYDHYSERFYVLALEVYGNIDEAYLTFAVSDDADPNGVWFKYRSDVVISIGSSEYWFDYPGLGFDQDGFYLTGNLFLLAGNGSGFGGVLFRSYDKAPLLTGSTATFTDIRDGGIGSVQAAQVFGNNQTPYFVSVASSSQIRLTALNNALTTPSFSTAIVNVPPFNFPPGGVQNNGGGGNLIDALDGRIMNVQWRDGRLWACHGVGDGGSAAIARWYEFDTGNWPSSGSPTLVQSGDINLGGGVSTFFPAIYTNEDNSTGMVIAQSSASQFASVQATGRIPADPVGSMSALTQLDIGNTAANGRWGDYFDICLDPADGTTFWMTGEIQTPTGWQTTINSFTVDAGTMPPPNDDWLDTIFIPDPDFSLTGSNVDATVEMDEQQLTNTGSTVWWYFDADEDGMITIDTFGSNFDTQLHIYEFPQSGQFVDLIPLVNNDNTGGLQSQVTFPVEAFQCYEIRVGGADGAEGDIMLTGVFVPQVCPFALGDVNMDGSTNLLDVGPFIAALSGGQYICEADVNQDGAVNLLDVDPFILVIAGP